MSSAGRRENKAVGRPGDYAAAAPPSSVMKSRLLIHHLVIAAGTPRNRRYGISDDYSGLIPANLITLAHFLVSEAMCLPNSAGEPGSTVALGLTIPESFLMRAEVIE